jgi:hypothetical protein
LTFEFFLGPLTGVKGMTIKLTSELIRPDEVSRICRMIDEVVRKTS